MGYHMLSRQGVQIIGRIDLVNEDQFHLFPFPYSVICALDLYGVIWNIMGILNDYNLP